jgi:hypothetical protein
VYGISERVPNVLPPVGFSTSGCRAGATKIAGKASASVMTPSRRSSRRRRAAWPLGSVAPGASFLCVEQIQFQHVRLLRTAGEPALYLTSSQQCRPLFLGLYAFGDA